MSMNVTQRSPGPIVALLLLSCLGKAETVDKEFLQALPAAEQSMKDDVDHWGLPFSDQLRRFVSARSSFRKTLGEQAPKNFIVGTDRKTAAPNGQRCPSLPVLPQAMFAGMSCRPFPPWQETTTAIL